MATTLLWHHLVWLLELLTIRDVS